MQVQGKTCSKNWIMLEGASTIQISELSILNKYLNMSIVSCVQPNLPAEVFKF